MLTFSKRGLFLLVLLAVSAAACSSYLPADIVRNQASFDMQCPGEKLEMTPLAGDCGKQIQSNYECTLGVRGCGKQTTYSHVPLSSTWIANAGR